MILTTQHLLLITLVILGNVVNVEMFNDHEDVHVDVETGQVDYYDGDPGDGGMEQEELFYQFRVQGFQAKTLNDTAVLLKWGIRSDSNGLDMHRKLIISTTYPQKNEPDEKYVKINGQICNKLSGTIGECNYPLEVKPCSNYLFHFGDGNRAAVSTVGIEPSSIREELLDNENGKLMLSWNITCDSEVMAPVSIALTEFFSDSKTPSLKQEQLIASCKNRKCRTRTTELRTSPCSNYSLQIDGVDDLRVVETPPKITDLRAEKIPSENQYFLRWSIYPVTCPIGPRLVVASVNDSLQTPQYSRLVINSLADYCKNGMCEYKFGVEPCVSYKIKSSGSSSSPVELLGSSMSKISKEYTGDLYNPVKLRWQMCGNEQNDVNIIISPTNDTSQRVSNSLQVTCDRRSRLCSSNVTIDQNVLRPCSQYKLEVNGSKETLLFEAPPQHTISISEIVSGFSINQTLTISLTFELQRSCDLWNVSMEMQILDLSLDVMTLSCHKKDDLPDSTTKHCSVSVPIKKTDIICLSEHRIKTRPLYSRTDLTSKVYRGNWSEAKVEPTKPSEWTDGEALTELVVESDVHKKKVIVEWKSPICLNGSTIYSTNVGIVSRSQRYYVTIPFSCSRLNEVEERISKNRRVVIDNGQITCTDGNQLHQDQEETFELSPCTSYSITLTPLAVENEELRNISVTSNSTTAFVPLDVGNLSDKIGVTASHSFGYEWQFNLNFSSKENNPCSKRIDSAVLQISNGRQFNQTIRCNQGIACNGIVKLNHFNMCRPLPVTIGFQYSQTEIKGHVSWFNKTLPPFVVNQTSGKTFNSLTINYTNRHRFEIQWQDHICLPNGSVSSSVLEIRPWNGTVIRPFNVPHNCSYTGKSKLHRVFLEENKLVCQENSTLYHIQLPPCTDYLVSLTPVVKGTNAPQVEYSQSINFTTPFDPSSIENLKTANVTSSNFELQWTIPRQCSNTSEMSIEVDGEKYSSLSFGFLSRPYTECDEVKCRVTWSNPTDLSLDPCTTYNIRIGPFTNETITTLPRDNGLTIFPEKTNVTTKLSGDSHLNITLTIDELDLRCSSRLIAIDFELPDVEPPIKQNLTCKLNIFDQQASSSEVVCSQEIPIIRMDKCIPYNFTFRPVYENGLFSDEVRSVRMKLNPLLSEEEKNELHVPPEVEIYGPQTIRLYWNDPVCLMTTDVLSWEIRINNTENEYRIHLATECSSGCHLPFTNKSNPFKNSFQLDKGRISWCHHQSTNKTGSIIVSKCDLVFMPCSMYVVSVIPFVGVSNFTALEKFVETTHFNTSIDKIHPKISKITFNTLELIWSFPLRCVLLIPTDHMTTLIINKTETIEISFSNLSSSKCDEMTCLMNWKSPSLLSACTEYLISIDLVDQKIFTVPNSSDHSACGFSDNSETKLSRQEFSTDSNVAEDKLVLLGWIIGIGLGFLGLTLVFVTIGILFGIFKKTITLRETGRYDISKKNSTSMNSTKATKENVTRINGAVN